MMSDVPSYRRSAAFYDRLYDFKDYETVNRRLLEAVRRHHPTARTLLDVGCGTGRHLAALAPHFEVEGSDLSPEMLHIARTRCPGVPLHVADMAELDLGERSFDVITCLFSAIGYVIELPRLRSALAGFARHLRPGGLLLLEPWFTPEQYWSGHITANDVDAPDMTIRWMYLAELDGARSVFDIHYLVGNSAGVEHFTERHVMGLFTDEQYRDAFVDAGLEVEREPEGFFGRGVYIGHKPAR